MKVKVLIYYGIGISYVLFALGLNANDIGLPSLFTFNRIAFLILVLIFLLTLHKGKRNFKLYYHEIINLLLIYFIIIWSLLSLLKTNTDLTILNFVPTINWVLILITIFILLFLFRKITYTEIIKLIKLIVICGSVITIFTFFWVFIILGIQTDSLFEVRTTFNSSTSVGMSRYLNGLFLLNVFTIPVVLNIIKDTNKVTKILSLFSVVSLVSIGLFLGSRQTILSILVFVVLLFIYLFAYRIYLKQFVMKEILKKSLSVSILLLLICVIGSLFLDLEILRMRFFETTLDQYENKGVRQINIEIGLQLMKNNIIFGIGPGNFLNYSYNSVHPHNGLIGFGSAFGPLSLVVILSYLIFIIMSSFRKDIMISYKDKYKGIFITFGAFIITFVFVSNMFNDLFDVYILWGILALYNSMLFQKDRGL